LSLLFKPRKCRKLLQKLRAAPMSEYPAKDILRASRTAMSEVAAFDWSHHQQQIRDGEALGPILSFVSFGVRSDICVSFGVRSDIWTRTLT
jgi:hypothetical protein